MIPENINKEHILSAITEIDKKGVPKGRHSSTYDLVHNGNSYPPKLIISLANKYANGEELDHNDFEGGKGKPAFQLLEQYGFEISRKEMFTWVKTHSEIVQYLRQNRNNQIDLIQLLRNLDIAGLHDEDVKGQRKDLTEIDPFSFFCYIYKFGSVKRLQLLQALSKELKLSYPLDEKGIPSVNAQKVCLFPFAYERQNDEINRLWNFFEDALNANVSDVNFEDTLAINSTGKIKLTEGLFNILPDKYFPINGPTKPYLKAKWGINPEFKTYTEYSNILKEIRKNTDLPFYQLSHDAWQWSNTQEKNNYWIFQGNPDLYDISGAIQNGQLTNWSVKAHKSKITEGDKVIIWATGKESGVYALAEVSSEVYDGMNNEQEQSYYTNGDKNEPTSRVDITITHDLSTKPIFRSEIDKHKELGKMKVGSQGTNFSAKKDEYEMLKRIVEMRNQTRYWIYAPGANASHWDEFYEKGIMGLGWDELGDLNNYKSKDEIVKKLQELEDTKNSKKNDSAANWEFKNEIQIGDIIIPKKGRRDYLGYGIVTSEYYFDNTRKKYQKCRKVKWVKKGVWADKKGDIVLKTLTDVTEYEDYVLRLKKLIGISEHSISLKSSEAINQAINTILYGPPGTGKTYTLSKEYFPKYTTTKSLLTKEKHTEQLIKDCSWWQVIALTLLDLGTSSVSDIFDHHWIKIKTKYSNSKSITPTLWGQLQAHTILECELVKYKSRTAPFIFNKTTGKKWEILKEEVSEQTPELMELYHKINEFKPSDGESLKRYVFTTFHQSFSYEDFIEGIKPVMEESENEGEVKYEIKSGVFKQLCTDARNDRDNRYAIFIDEINRGNVSAIFGELITLIEQDKREGQPNEMTATLPYSKEEFSVPSNVDIYGTMNTADRSVEALDSALRRRFSFEELRPKPELLTELNQNATNIEGVNFVELLKTINERIELVLDKDHQIGHSYFIGVDNISSLKQVFVNKVFPLLEEYFFGDFGKIGLIVGGSFIEEVEKGSKVKLAANFKYDDANYFAEKKVYKYTASHTWGSAAFQSIYTDPA